ncbi:MAG TPA: TlpA disulfide reductase family protein [Blastocatellia bacterium]|nr:TlpA disulfide reductase family protein [Blastocatellia bacterium]
MNEIKIDETRKQRDGWRSFFDPAYIVLLAGIAIAVVFIVMLSRDKARLKAELGDSTGTLCGPQSTQVSDIVPAFKTSGVNGSPEEVGFDGSRRYLIVIFSPACGVCSHELPAWNRLAKAAESMNVAVRGISLDPLDETKHNLEGKQVDFRTLIMPSMSVRRAYRVVSIPEIMIVSSRGFVEWIHYGEMKSEKEEELLAKLRSG